MFKEMNDDRIEFLRWEIIITSIPNFSDSFSKCLYNLPLCGDGVILIDKFFVFIT